LQDSSKEAMQSIERNFLILLIYLDEYLSCLPCTLTPCTNCM
jgi:hypothetical protein